MKDVIDLFSELGARLADFGRDALSREVIVRANEANGWFSPEDIRRSVAALRCEMLRRDRLEAWLSAYKLPAAEPRRVLVVMAGNIPLVGFFDLLCVVAAGHCCLVKPSSKDFVLIEYVVALLRAIDPQVSVAFYDGCEAVDAVIATGSDNTNRYFRTCYEGTPSLLRGSRQSVAVLSGMETSEQLEGLADDVFAYSGLGCRNVSLVFVPRGCDLRLKPVAMNEKYYRNYIQTKALLEMRGCRFRDLDSAVLVEQQEFPALLSCLSYAYYDSLQEVEAWLAEHDDALQCVATECLPHPRRVDFGHAQSPALTDYPDERDVIAFLLSI